MEGFSISLPAIALSAAFVVWFGVSCVAVVGRVGYERRGRLASRGREPVAGWSRRRLLRRAAAHRTEGGKWRRISALRRLARARDPRSRRLLHRALADGDSDIVGAAVRSLGEIADDWAVDELLAALIAGTHPRSRVATQLEPLTLRIGPQLVELLDHGDPSVRFWGATLLSGCPGLALDRLVALTGDTDANVRAAAVESIGDRGETAGLDAVRVRLDDDVWFVRVHACRAAGRLGGLNEASRIAGALGDPWWWVRAAAKDALRGLGIDVAGVLVSQLDDDDAFARNGAAEVLQDVGFVDMLSRHGAEGELLERIFAAGGAGLREAALLRTEDDAADVRTLDGVAS
jgi:HEAT repeat protein